MSISGSKSKLRKGGSRPEGWFRLDNCRWEERTSQNTGQDYIALVVDLESADSDEPREQMFFLGRSLKVGDYVTVTEDGALVSVDEDDEYEIPEYTAVGKFFGTMSEEGVSDKIMDQVGDNPGALNGLVLKFEQVPVLDNDGNVKKNDAGYDITDTLVVAVGDDSNVGGKKKGKSKKTAAKKTSAKRSRKAAPVEEDEDDFEDEDEDDFEDDFEDEEEEEPAPKKRRRGKN